MLDNCAICMQEAGTLGDIRYLSSCTHPFCAPCLGLWEEHCTRKGNVHDLSCPTCRRITVDLT